MRTGTKAYHQGDVPAAPRPTDGVASRAVLTHRWGSTVSLSEADGPVASLVAAVRGAEGGLSQRVSPVPVTLTGSPHRVGHTIDPRRP